MAIKLSTGTQLFDANIAAASRGNASAYFELGVSYSTGTDGVAVDMIEAHKWFNLAALAGVKEGSVLRAEIAAEMDREEIAEAQRQARAWIAALSAAPTNIRSAA
jgi:TPR repeat protein